MKSAIGLDDPTLSFQFDDFALLNMAQGTHTHTRAQILQMHWYVLRTLNCVKTNPILIRYTSPFFFLIFTLNSAWITWKILTAEALQTSFYQSWLLRLHPLSSVKI